MNHLPLGNWLTVNKTEFSIGLILGFAEKVITQAGGDQTRNGEALWQMG